MNTDEREFKHREVSKKTIGVFHEVYNELGHGFIESVSINQWSLRSEQPD